MPVFDYFHQVKLLLPFKVGQAKIVQDKQVRFGKFVKELQYCAIYLAILALSSSFCTLK